MGTDKIELPKGWGIFINSGILHRFEAQCSTFTPNIVFSPALLAPEQSLIYEKYISPVINSQVPYEILNPNTPWNHHILELLSQIFSIQETQHDNKLHTIQLLQLLDTLSNNLHTVLYHNSLLPDFLQFHVHHNMQPLGEILGELVPHKRSQFRSAKLLLY